MCLCAWQCPGQVGASALAVCCQRGVALVVGDEPRAEQVAGSRQPGPALLPAAQTCSSPLLLAKVSLSAGSLCLVASGKGVSLSSAELTTLQLGRNSYTTALAALVSRLERRKECADKFRGAANLAAA